MRSWTCRDPCANSRSFLRIRLKSEADGSGLRIPTEFTHNTRLCFASRCIMCFLLRGSPSQSLQKQMMSCPLIICTRCPGNVHAKGVECRNGYSLPHGGCCKTQNRFWEAARLKLNQLNASARTIGEFTQLS